MSILNFADPLFFPWSYFIKERSSKSEDGGNFFPTLLFNMFVSNENNICASIILFSIFIANYVTFLVITKKNFPIVTIYQVSNTYVQTIVLIFTYRSVR